MLRDFRVEKKEANEWKTKRGQLLCCHTREASSTLAERLQLGVYLVASLKWNVSAERQQIRTVIRAQRPLGGAKGNAVPLRIISTHQVQHN